MSKAFVKTCQLTQKLGARTCFSSACLLAISFHLANVRNWDDDVHTLEEVSRLAQEVEQNLCLL
jgi:hypothetical protein